MLRFGCAARLEQSHVSQPVHLVIRVLGSQTTGLGKNPQPTQRIGNGFSRVGMHHRVSRTIDAVGNLHRRLRLRGPEIVRCLFAPITSCQSEDSAPAVGLSQRPCTPGTGGRTRGRRRTRNPLTIQGQTGHPDIRSQSGTRCAVSGKKIQVIPSPVADGGNRPRLLCSLCRWMLHFPRTSSRWVKAATGRTLPSGSDSGPNARGHRGPLSPKVFLSRNSRGPPSAAGTRSQPKAIR